MVNSRRVPHNYRVLVGSEKLPSVNAKYVGQVADGELIRVTVVLRRNPAGLSAPDFDFFGRTSPTKRVRLERGEFAEKYGASPSEVQAVEQFARSNGLAVLESNLARRMVILSGSAAQISQAFSVDLGVFEHSAPGSSSPTRYRGRYGAIHLPSEILDSVVGVFGLDNKNISKPGHAPDPPVIAKIPVQTAAQCYSFPTNSATGQNIAILTPSGYYPPDLVTYFSPATPPVYDVFIGLIEGNGQQADAETTQDICIAASAAPGAQVGVYFHGGDESGWIEVVQRVVHPDPGDAVCSVMETSYYISQGDDLPTLAAEEVSVSFVNAFHLALQDAAIQGVTFITISGDYGVDMTAYGGGTSDGQVHVTYPASDPWALGCGGTTLGCNSGTISASNFVEYVWNDGWGASGGGVSNFFPVPSYQQNVTIPNSFNGGKQGRGVPDVSANASGNTGYPITVNQAPAVGDGTSAAGPLVAGLVAVINAELATLGVGYTVGFLNPMLYALGESVCRDVDAVDSSAPAFAGPLDNSHGALTGYPAVQGWDPCTGWGSINGTALLNALRNQVAQDCYFIVDWSTFVKLGVAEMQGPSNQPAVFTNAFYIVAEGFSAAELKIGMANAVIPQFSFSPSQPSGMTIQVSPAQPDPNAPLRYTFPCQITFTDTSGFPTGGQEVLPIEIIANLPGTAGPITSNAIFTLTSQTSPFTVPGPVTWLSNDIRVFQMEPGDSPTWLQLLNSNISFPVQLVNTGSPSQAPYDADATIDATYFIQQLIAGFNTVSSMAPPTHPFDLIPSDEATSALDTLEVDMATNAPVFNFAVARVRYQDLGADAENVRVFFRTFPALAVSTAYEPSTTYRRWSDGVEFGHTIPLLGSENTAQFGQLETIPFFASPRIKTTAVSMDTQTDLPNVQTMSHNGSGGVTYAYFGCWLDINMATQSPFPQTPTTDGPFSSQPGNPLVPIAQLLGNQHQCLTVEVAFDPVPIPAGATPGTSTMLGQRNLTTAPAANPGSIASRSIANGFEMLATAPEQTKEGKPHELMIDWGNMPPGTQATLYMPEIDVRQVLIQAQALYGINGLAQLDAHTLSLEAGGITYIPIPESRDAAVAALLTVNLPYGIRRGQLYRAIVAQIGSVSVDRGAVARRRLGAFQIDIPVSVKSEMLSSEEQLLSNLRWIDEGIAKSSGWAPVFHRYMRQIADRVESLGGDPGEIRPSPIGLGKRPCRWKRHKRDSDG